MEALQELDFFTCAGLHVSTDEQFLPLFVFHSVQSYGFSYILSIQDKCEWI